MPILTHAEATLAASLLEAYGAVLDTSELVLDDTPENRNMAASVPYTISHGKLLFPEIAVAEYLRKRLLDAEVDFPEWHIPTRCERCERCGMECSGEVRDGVDFRIYQCDGCGLQYCHECVTGRHEPNCSVAGQKGYTSVDA